MRKPIVTLTTDFGLQDHYVGAMKGVILGICPQAQIVDISHEVKPFQISEGAFLLAQAYSCFPPKTCTSPWWIRAWAPLGGQFWWKPPRSISWPG